MRWGVRGIYLRKRARPFEVRFTRNKRDVYVGSYHSLAEAKRAARAFIARPKEEVNDSHGDP